MESVTVLVGLNLRAAQEHEKLRGLAEHVAYLHLGEPSLCTMLDERRAAGDTELTLIPVNLHGEPGQLSWLRRVAAHWLRANDHPLTIQVGTRVLTEPGELTELLTEPAKPVTDAAPLCSPAWEHVPAYRHHLFVCRGPRCSAKGAERTAAAVKETLRDNGIGEDQVLVTQTGCLFPCNHAPVLAVHPDDVWYGRIGPREVPGIVAEHLIGGRAVAAHRLHRG